MATTFQPLTIHWRRSLLWLCFLGPFFFISYGLCNQLAADRGISQSIVFNWELGIPLWPWSIVPYWSIDLLYGLSFMLCRTTQSVDRHAFRLLSAQLISVVFFTIAPLRFSFQRPAIEGIFGDLFNLLAGFDQPFNQAPSLHISLLIIIWSKLAQLPNPWRLAVHSWCALIGVSVLTTYQHHFIDVPTGAAVGLLCLWLWPDQGPAPLAIMKCQGRRASKIALFYAAGASLCLGLVWAFQGAAWWLLWPGLAFFLVAGNYSLVGALGFQKLNGVRSLAVELLLAPYTLCAWLNSRAWTYFAPQPIEICDGVWLGRMPSAHVMRSGEFVALIDLAPELPCPTGNWRVISFPCLDLIAPEQSVLTAAAECIEQQRLHGPVLVACALGYSRSACAVLAWLLASARAANVEDAEGKLRMRKPQIVLSATHRERLAKLQEYQQEI